MLADARKLGPTAVPFYTSVLGLRTQSRKKGTLLIKGCRGTKEVWPGDLSCDTKKLIREVYARDFELLCKHFGYCDAGENVCLTEVPEMCPSNMSQKIASATYCA